MKGRACACNDAWAIGGCSGVHALPQNGWLVLRSPSSSLPPSPSVPVCVCVCPFCPHLANSYPRCVFLATPPPLCACCVQACTHVCMRIRTCICPAPTWLTHSRRASPPHPFSLPPLPPLPPSAPYPPTSRVYACRPHLADSYSCRASTSVLLTPACTFPLIPLLPTDRFTI